MNQAVRFCVIALLVFVPATAFAGTIVTGDKVKITGSTGTLGGGPFSLDGPDAGSGTDFLTFCIEIDEHISYNNLYYAKIATVAVEGGAGGPNPDPLDSRTAYLYSNFIKGTLVGYDSSSVDDRNGLQLAIWRIEDEVYRNGGGAYRRSDTNATMGSTPNWARADAFYDLANGIIHPVGELYGVRVLQLWTDDLTKPGLFNINRQDQLIYVPEMTSSFSTVLLGVSLLGVARRRFRP